LKFPAAAAMFHEIQQKFLLIAVWIAVHANPHRQGGAIIQLQRMARISQIRDQTPNTVAA
jgi:ribosomal protein S11